MANKILIFILLIFCFKIVYLYGAEPNYCIFCHKPHHLSYKRCESCHRGISITKRKDIAHYRIIPGDFAYFRLDGSRVLKQGYEIIDRSGCRRCHIILGKGNNLATSLDNLPQYIEINKLIQNIKSPSEFMPYFSFSDKDITSTVNVILKGIYFYKKSKQEIFVIHFEGSKTDDEFTRHCGNCHKVISKKYGPLGKGNWGPNLSGLFSLYFPTEKGRWNRERLIRWIKNPREIDKNSLMPPIEISNESMQKLMEKIFLE